jgi:hypothetical protein
MFTMIVMNKSTHSFIACKSSIVTATSWGISWCCRIRPASRCGTLPGEFGGNTGVKSRAGGPNFLAIDSQANFYATETMDGRVQKLTADGKFLRRLPVVSLCFWL